jgi:carboxyl-terminal processing protease
MTIRRFVTSLAILQLLADSHTSHASNNPIDFQARGAEIIGLVRNHFFDPRASEVWAAKYSSYATRITDEGQFVRRTNEILAELKASHTGYYTRNEPQHAALAAIFGSAIGIEPKNTESIGADFTPDGFLRVVFAGGPASTAGLRRGDKVLKVNGADFHPVLAFRGKAGHKVVLTVQRHVDAAAMEIPVVPQLIHPKKEWLDAQKNGSRIIERNGKKIAYVPMFSCAGQEFEQLLRDQLRDRFQVGDSLIIDFRDGWGGCALDFVNLFTSVPAVMTMIGRDGQRNRIDTQWRKPVVILINGESRSGKEIVAYTVRKHKLGTLVGERTGGAVVAGRCFKLSDGSLLYLAVKDIEIDGERLEGRGIEPHVKVDAALPFANGSDPQLEKAIEIASRSQ